MSGYINEQTGKRFTHGCDDCAGPAALLETVAEEEQS